MIKEMFFSILLFFCSIIPADACIPGPWDQPSDVSLGSYTIKECDCGGDRNKNAWGVLSMAVKWDSSGNFSLATSVEQPGKVGKTPFQRCCRDVLEIAPTAFDYLLPLDKNYLPFYFHKSEHRINLNGLVDRFLGANIVDTKKRLKMAINIKKALEHIQQYKGTDWGSTLVAPTNGELEIHFEKLNREIKALKREISKFDGIVRKKKRGPLTIKDLEDGGGIPGNLAPKTKGEGPTRCCVIQ